MAGTIPESFENSTIFEESLSKWTGGNETNSDFAPLDLHTAASIGETKVVKDILDKNRQVNKLNRGGWSPLMYASYMGHGDVIKLFLSIGADPEQRTPQGSTSLILAAMCGYDSVMNSLIKHGAELEAKDNKGWTALFHAVSSGHQQTTNFLITAGAKLNIVEPLQFLTPLMEAAACGHECIVEDLLKQGVDISPTDKNGDDAIKLAQIYGNSEICQLIEKHKYGRMSGEYQRRNREKQGRPTLQPPVLQNYDSSGPSIHAGPRGLAEMTGLGADGKPRPSETDVSPLLLDPPERTKPQVAESRWDGPNDLAEVLEEIGCTKYLKCFKEQDVDLRIFLTLTESDMKEIGVGLLGPRRKMTATIGRMNNLVKANMGSRTELGYNDSLFLKLKNMEEKLQESEEKNSNLSTQLAQERQLRSVAESVLIEQKDFKTALQRGVDKLLKEHHHLEMSIEKLKLVSKPVKNKGPQYESECRSALQHSYDCLLEFQQILQNFGSPPHISKLRR